MTESAGLKAKIEGLIIAEQDQRIPTRNYPANIKKNGPNTIYELCEQKIESINH